MQRFRLYSGPSYETSVAQLAEDEGHSAQLSFGVGPETTSSDFPTESTLPGTDQFLKYSLTLDRFP